MAEAIIQVLVENLSSLMKKEIGLMMGVDKEMNKLSSTLTTIQAVLQDAEDKQFENEPIRNWLCKLNDLAFEIEDIVDECATEFSKLQHNKSRINRYSLKKILYRRRIGKRIKEVTEKLVAVAAERSNFHLDEMVVQRQSMVDTTRETCSNLNEPDLVYGREEDMEKIVDILVNHVQDSQQLSVLPIIGIGGLGKTTLAQLVYNHPHITEHFEKKLWGCVSDNFDTKTLVKAMIDSATGSRSASDNLDSLQRDLRELLNHKRYLLILDDVWNEDQDEWAKLQSVLACGSKGASIVVTTRIRKVAEIMGTLPAHELSKLSEEYCWSLFRQRAFGHAMEEYPNLEAIGRQIVKKCGGVPLAAKALGGLLRFKRTEKEWVYVKESEIWNLQTSIMPALRLSYHHLPLHLRQCFAYCAVYPKDYWMKKEEVIYCWMAHGYISSNGRMDVEDVGNDVWNELVLRSLFQDVICSIDGRVYFNMHDLVHDLAQSIMKNKVPGADSTNQIAMNKNNIRQVNAKEVNVSYTLKNFNRLRVLNATWTDTTDFPSEIDRLKHLRYLNLSNSSSLHTLPDTVCSLWNLQILNLNYCRSLVELPKRMRYMKNLRHLLLDGCFSLREMPPKIGELTSLKTLPIFIVGHKRGNELDELEKLNLGGKLEIRHLERVKNHLDAEKANMANMSNRRHLVLHWESQNDSKQQQEMAEKVLEALQPHSNLEKLEIYGFRGRYFPPWTRMEKITEIRIENFPNCSRLPPLGDFPRLKFLKLTNLAALEYVMENEEVKDAILFPSLELLQLDSLPNLKGLLKHEEEVGDHIFPNLQQLDIGKSPMLILPPALSSLKYLSCSSLNLNSFSKLGNLTDLSVGFDNDTRTCITKETLESISNLEELELDNAKEQNLRVEEEEEGVQGLKSVRELRIRNSDTLTCLPDVWLRQFTSIEELCIDNCKELVELIPKEGIVISSLVVLQLYQLPKMVCLPEGLHQMIPSLQFLHLYDLPQLTSLPHWLPNFISLQHLKISDCRQLTSLPASIQGMTNLKTVGISGCPELEKRCEKEKGEDWHIIAHIPNLRIW